MEAAQYKRCCFCFKKKLKSMNVDEEEEVEQAYTSGESDTEFDCPYNLLNKHEKVERVMYLWKRVFLKSKGAAHILSKFGELNKKIYLYGAAKKLIERDEY